MFVAVAIVSMLTGYKFEIENSNIVNISFLNSISKLDAWEIIDGLVRRIKIDKGSFVFTFPLIRRLSQLNFSQEKLQQRKINTGDDAIIRFSLF